MNDDSASEGARAITTAPETTAHPPDGGARRIQVVDSHTEGEPTRVVVAGGPDLGAGTAARRLARLRDEHDDFRTAVIGEPRGSDVLVGALLCAPSRPGPVAQVIFFNNVGYLGMCVHGTIGVARTLIHRAQLGIGRSVLETPVGDVTVIVGDDDAIAVDNVESYRYATKVEIATRRHGVLRGDVAYGGNWFLLVDVPGLEISRARVDALVELAGDLRESALRQGVRGADGAEIDHIELCGAPGAGGDGRNFVLCPGGAYDRSPCGTGTSAKMACLAADGRLHPGEVWRQEGILGTSFVGSVTNTPRGVLPTLRGRAFITSEATLIVDPRDPFATGIRD